MPMNTRLQKYKKNRLAGMNIYNAARAAGYSEAYARKAKPEKVAKGSMTEALEQAGLTDKFISERLAEGCLAEKTISVESDLTDDNGKKEWVHVTVPDYQARAKFIELSSKMSGRLVDKLNVTGIPSTQVNVYPNKVVVFKDLDESSIKRDRDLHVAESPARVGTQGEIQSP